jgi:hypothetical protein
MLEASAYKVSEQDIGHSQMDLGTWIHDIWDNILFRAGGAPRDLLLYRHLIIAVPARESERMHRASL